MNKSEFSARLSSYYKLRNILCFEVLNFHEGAGKVPHYWLGGRGEIVQRQWGLFQKENFFDILRRHFFGKKTIFSRFLTLPQ